LESRVHPELFCMLGKSLRKAMAVPKLFYKSYGDTGPHDMRSPPIQRYPVHEYSCCIVLRMFGCSRQIPPHNRGPSKARVQDRVQDGAQITIIYTRSSQNDIQPSRYTVKTSEYKQNLRLENYFSRNRSSTSAFLSLSAVSFSSFVAS
jgi:hypothetical protein